MNDIERANMETEPRADSILITSVLPERVSTILRRTKYQAVMDPELDRSDISAKMLTLGGSMRSQDTNSLDFTERELAIIRLLFWVNNTESLKQEVYPHPEYVLSSYLAEKINAVWDAAPDLLGPNVYWTTSMRDVGYSGFSLAEVLCMRGILLDPQVLNDGPRQALAREFGSERCIELAIATSRTGILDMMVSLSPAVGAIVYDKLCNPRDIEKLCVSAVDALIVGTSRADIENSFTGVMNAKTARRLLAGMAAAGVESLQSGWASSFDSPPDANGNSQPSALKSVAVSVLNAAGKDNDLDGLRKMVRDVGTIVGYNTDSSGDKALVREFAAAISHELLHCYKSRWPCRFGIVDLDPQTNSFIGSMLSKYESEDTEGSSFFDGLMKYFAEADIDPDEGIGYELSDAAYIFKQAPKMTSEPACTLRYALQTSMPAGTVESYEAMYRAQTMAGVIAKAVAENSACIEQPRRRGMQV